MSKLGVIILAGGTGVRMGSTVPKQFMELAGKPVLKWSIEAFESTDCQVVVVLPEEYMDWDAGPHKKCRGGETRFASVRCGLEVLDADCDFIAVHDGARPLVSKRVILNALECAERFTSGVPAVAVTDTLRKMVNRNGGSRTEDRTMYRAVQTPQIFRADILRKAYQAPFREDFTDDASVVGAAGYRIVLSRGDRQNIKITEPVDLKLAEALISRREAEREAERAN